MNSKSEASTIIGNVDLGVLCRGDAHAVRFVRAYWAYCHLLDDLHDRDKAVDPERLIRESLSFIVEVASNPFFQANRLNLLALIVQAANAWLDANRWATRPEESDRRAADVIKSLYHEAIFHVAFVCGGWEHLRAVTKASREYDFEVHQPHQTPTDTPSHA